MSVHQRSKKFWYKHATVKAVVLYVAIVILMEGGMLVAEEFVGQDRVVDWLSIAQPLAVFTISILFIWFYGRSWLKHYKKPTDLLSDYLTNSPTIHFELRREDNNFRVHWVSKNAERILGYSVDQIKAPNWWYNHLHPADRSAIVKKALRGLDQPEFVYEYRFQHADGQYIWVRDHIRQEDPAGKRIKGSWQNITQEFTITEGAISDATDIDLIVGLAELDDDYRITHIDTHFAAIIGMPNDGVNGLRLDDIVTPTQPILTTGLQAGQSVSVIGRREDFSRFKAQLVIKQCETTHRLIACLTDISALEQERQALVHEAYYNDLTGLPNLRSLHRNFSQLIEALAEDRLAALVVININKFHQINHRYGALVGDQTLNRIARRLKETMPFGSKLYSGNGDEFIVLVNNITEYIDVQVITEKLLSAFEQKFVINHNAQFYLTCSAGASIYPLDGYDSEQLLSQAHTAMLTGRQANATNAVIFQHDVEQPSHRQLQLNEDIQSALAHQQLEVFYQPILDKDHRVVAAEALLRWHHPEFGLLTASEFVHHAEQTHMLTDIGLWTLVSVAKQLNQWLLSESSIQHVSINLSASQITPQLVSKFTQLLADSPQLKNRLSVELSEEALNEAEPMVGELIQQLAGMGVGITIDDFGTGFASLSYMAEYPIDTVKIDRSFIRHVVENERTQQIIGSIVRLAHDAEVEVQAEGVEDKKQLELILQLGCLKWQGHLIHPAKPVDELINLD